MKKLALLLLCAGLSTAPAATVVFELSPAGTDNAVGLSPLNETPPVTNSVGSGNTIGSGIALDTDTLLLDLSIGYGGAFGFTDLTGPATAAHIHGPAPTNTPAPIVIDLSGLHTLATNPADGGSIVGNVLLTTNQAMELLNGLYYVNIHTATNPAGEIRGQLIAVDTLPELVCPPAVTAECAGEGGTFVQVAAQVADADGDALEVVWWVNGAAIQTNHIDAEVSTNLTTVDFDALYDLGTNAVTVTVSDGIGSPVSCGTTVTILDRLPPTISSLSVDPFELWPPNHKFRPVTVTVVASDACGGTNVTCRITDIRSNEPVWGRGDRTSPDWVITGDLTAKLRAERLGRGNGRVYTLTIECSDAAGNISQGEVTVTVPHDQRHRMKHQPPAVIVQPPAPANPPADPPGNPHSKPKSKPHGKGKNK
jgi:hypothetical protein